MNNEIVFCSKSCVTLWAQETPTKVDGPYMISGVYSRSPAIKLIETVRKGAMKEAIIVTADKTIHARREDFLTIPNILEDLSRNLVSPGITSQ